MLIKICSEIRACICLRRSPFDNCEQCTPRPFEVGVSGPHILLHKVQFIDFMGQCGEENGMIYLWFLKGTLKVYLHHKNDIIFICFCSSIGNISWI